MSKGVKSARGDIVDFDLLKIREQIASSPKPTNVQAREEFIDRKFKRRLKKLTNDVTQTASQSAGEIDTAPVETTVDEEIVEDVVIDKSAKPKRK